MRIVRRLPFFADETTVDSPTGPQKVVPFQVVVQIALSIRGAFSNPFPAILDTGHSHNLSISEQHLLDWVGVRPHDLTQLGHITVNGQVIPLRRAYVGILRKRPGTRKVIGTPFLLETPGGIAVFQDSRRLPLLGMKALVRSRLKTRIDGENLTVTIGRGWLC